MKIQGKKMLVTGRAGSTDPHILESLVNVSA